MDAEFQLPSEQQFLNEAEATVAPFGMSNALLYTCLDELTRVYERELRAVQTQYQETIETALLYIKEQNALLLQQKTQLHMSSEEQKRYPQAAQEIPELLRKIDTLEKRIATFQQQAGQVREATVAQCATLDKQKDELQERNQQLTMMQEAMKKQEIAIANQQRSMQELTQLLQEERNAHKSCENALRSEVESRRRATEYRQTLEQQVEEMQAKLEDVGVRFVAQKPIQSEIEPTTYMPEEVQAYENTVDEKLAWEQAELSDAMKTEAARQELDEILQELRSQRELYEQTQQQLENERLLCKVAQEQAQSSREGLKVLQAKLQEYEGTDDEQPQPVRWGAFETDEEQFETAVPTKPVKAKTEQGERGEAAELAERASAQQLLTKTPVYTQEEWALYEERSSALADDIMQRFTQTQPQQSPRQHSLITSVETAEKAEIAKQIEPVNIGQLSEGEDMKEGFTQTSQDRADYVRNLSPQARTRMQQTLQKRRQKRQQGFGNWLKDSVENVIATTVKANDGKDTK